MKTAAKTITGFLCLLPGLLLPLVSLVFTIKKQDVRQHMRKELERATLQTITVPAEEVFWVEKHEIWVHGRMFDFKSVICENGIYTFTGLFDDRETSLVNQEKDLNKKNRDKGIVLSELFKYLLTLYHSPVNDPETPAEAPLTRTGWNTGHPVTPFREIWTPPPQHG